MAGGNRSNPAVRKPKQINLFPFTITVRLPVPKSVTSLLSPAIPASPYIMGVPPDFSHCGWFSSEGAFA
jgi:hypothetical protein